MDWGTRTLKRGAREFALASPGPWQGYLGLPGGTCCDIEHALGTGQIGPGTRVMLAEADPREADRIEQWLAARWPWDPPLLHFGWLHDLAVPHPVDMAFLDYLGNPSASDWDWMDRVLRPRLLPAASAALTASLATRGKAFQTAIERHLRRDVPEEWRLAREAVEPLWVADLVARGAAALLLMTQAQSFPDRTVATAITFYREVEARGITMMLLRFDPHSPEPNPFASARPGLRRWLDHNLAVA